MTHVKTDGWSVFLSHKVRDEQNAVTAASAGRGYQLSAVEAQFINADLAATSPVTCSAIDLIYDSFAQPLPPGTRSAGMHVRQMLYRTEHYQIDVQIEAQPDGNRLVIMGQLLDTRRPGIVDVGVHVTLSDGRGNMVHTKTNQFGEFRGEVGNSGDLELSFLGRDGKSIVILLREVLDPMSRGKN